jgi:hypothetical protein
MSQSNDKQVWIDPNSTALAYLKKYEVQKHDRATAYTTQRVRPKNGPKRRERKSAASTKALTRREPNAVVVLPKINNAISSKPNPLPAPVPIPQMPAPTFTPPADLNQFEHQARQIAATLDFNIPEGFLDRVFVRKNHRLLVKIERAELMRQFESATTAIVRERCNTAEALRQLNQIRFQQFLDALMAWQTADEAHYRIAFAHERVENERVIEAAKTRAEVARHAAQIALYERQIRDAQREPLPPPPPPLPPPPPSPVDKEALAREEAQRARRREYTIALDELDDAAKFLGEKTGKGLEAILRVFADAKLRRAARRVKILELIQTYEIDESLLPTGVQELLEEDDHVDDDV